MMAREARTRTEIDDRLKDAGIDAKLYPSAEAKEQARWAEKQVRMGDTRKTLPDPRNRR